MDEDYEDIMRRKDKERKRKQIIDEVIPVPRWIQERMDKEKAEQERKLKEQLGEFAIAPAIKTKIPADAVQLIYSFGLEGSRRDNVAYLAEDLLVHACGDAVHFLTISTQEQTFLRSRAGRGIGAVAVHPQRKCFAVCEKGHDPDIIIYSYPELEEKKVMTNGTERIFTAASFNIDGTRLATVGGHPDYWLTVWDWDYETMISRSKAFSQEIFKVNFSQYFPGQLITSGVGHIRFWKMASTFTGLKLEGAIAKFGTVSISDVAGFVELRNSKVLSGTDAGTILVWDDGLIKGQLKRKGQSMCHDSMIEFITLDEDAQQMTTAGLDGYIKFWNLDWLEAANDGDDKLVCEIEPVRQVYLGDGVHIKGIVREEDHWIIQDDGGAIWRAKLPDFELEKVLEFHAGPIICVASSPVNYDLVSGGSDGTVRLYSFKAHQQRYLRKFSAGVSSMLWVPQRLDPTATCLIVGFADGVVRVMELTDDKWRLTCAMKPHKMDVSSMCLTPDTELLATGSKDGTIFFFSCPNDFKALGYFKVPGPVSSIDWSPTGQTLLVGCTTGHVVEICRPADDIDVSKSYELTLEMRSYTFNRPLIKRPKPPPEVKKVEEPPPQVEKVVLLNEWGDPIEEEPPPEIPPTEGSEGEVRRASTSGETARKGSVANTGGEEKKSSKVDPGGEARKGSKIVADAGGKRGSTLASDIARRKSSKALGEGEAKEGGSGNADETTGPSEGDSPGDSEPAPTPELDELEIPDEPGTKFPVRVLMYALGDLGTFYVAFEGKPAGFLFECHMYAENVMGYTPWLESPVKCMRYTHTLQYIISGSDNGIVRVQEMPKAGQLQLAFTESQFWEGGVHDGFYGVVSGAVLSFDDKLMASVSHDGSFFVQSIEIGPAIPGREPPPAYKAGGRRDTSEAQDVSPDALSIEEQRAKTEHDEKLRLALEKKNVELEKVASVRKRLNKLLEEMNQRERNEKLPLTEFEVDPHVRIMLAEETEHEIDMAKKEMQWDSEKKNVAVRKLRAWYLDPIEVEHIVLHAFRSGQTVCSFRTARLSEQMQAAIGEAQKQKGVRRWTKLTRPPRSFMMAEDNIDTATEAEQDERTQTVERSDSVGLDEQEDISRLEQRRLLLKQREKEMTKFLLTKPDETWVSEDDAEDIKWAEENKGDFKLKSDPNYSVPEELRTNHRIKRNDMLLFTEDIHGVRMTFNREFLELRDHKKVLRDQILKNNSRIEEINTALKVAGKPEPNLAAPGKGKLGSILIGAGKLSSTWKRVLTLIKDDTLFVPVIAAEERPEDRDLVTEEEAEVYYESKKLAAENKARASKTKDTLGLDQSGPKKDEKPAGGGIKHVTIKAKEPPKPAQKQVTAPVPKGYPTSAMEQQEQDMTQMKLKYEKQKLEEKNILIIKKFDDSVQDLKLRRFNLEINIKAAELKMMCLYQEMRYLQKIQPTEELLDEKLYQKLKGVHLITEKLADQEKAISKKQEEIADMVEKKAEIAKEFDSIFPDSEDPQKAVLHKLFVKAVRQVKRNPDGTIAESDSDSDLDEVAVNDDEDDYEEDDVAEVCPPNVTTYLYEQMFKLREMRVNQEVFIKEGAKALNALVKERDSILKKKKVVDAALDGVEKEIANFHKEKQFSMNEIEMVLSLRMSQIEYLDDGELPNDLSKGLVFDNSVFQQLRDTIKEHLKAKHQLKNLHRELRKEHQVLNRERKIQDERTMTIEARCTEVQMLKFGQTVEMSVLDAISKDLRKDTVQLKDRLKSQEAMHSAELASWNKQIDTASDDLRFCTKDNTAILHVIADIKSKQNELETRMKDRVKAPLKDPLMEKRKHASHHSMLVHIINEQEKETLRIQEAMDRLQNKLEKNYPSINKGPGDGQ